MSLPTESDFNKFSNTKLTGTEWNQNVDKTVDVLKEVMFFAQRSRAGTVFVFDDYPKFDMDLILKIIVNDYGFMLLKQGKNKIALKRN